MADLTLEVAQSHQDAPHQTGHSRAERRAERRRVQPVAKKDTFDESKHPRNPAGTGDKAGEFTETGRAGQPTSTPELAQQAKEGIVKIEKLLPTAVAQANYQVEGPEPGSWEDVDSQVQHKVESSWKNLQYEYGVDVDTTELDKEIRREVGRDNQEFLEEAKKEALDALEAAPEVFKDTDPTLPITGVMVGVNYEGIKQLEAEQFNLFKQLDPDTLDYGEGDHEDVDYKPDGTRDFSGRVKLNLDVLRFASGEELTAEQKQTVEAYWDEAYDAAYQKALERAFESDGYNERRSQLEDEQIQSEWDALDDDAKLDYMKTKPQFAKYVKPRVTAAPQEPTQWVTGIEKGKHGEENYDRTHAIAKKLTELRTDELRTERGLIGPQPKPTFTVDKGKDWSFAHPNYVAKDVHGVLIAASNTLALVTENAEKWAERQAANTSVLSTPRMIAKLWDEWKGSSSGPVAKALQLAAAQELGGVHRMTPEEVEQAVAASVDVGGMENIKAYVRAQWEVTQMVMQKAHQDKISVYRGLQIAGAKVNATPNVILDSEGHPLPGPTNIKVEQKFKHIVVDTPKGPAVQPTPWPQYETVTFQYGEHILEVEKKRLPGPYQWADVPEALQKQVHDIWNTRQKSRLPHFPGPVASETQQVMEAHQVAQAFEHFPEYMKLDLLRDFRRSGEIEPEPFESTGTAVARRVRSWHEEGEGDILTKLPEIVLQRAGAQSTTGTPRIANEWMGVGQLPLDATRVVLRIEAPPTSVLSLPVYGQNIATEHETVLLGAKDKWLWDAWRDTAPTFEAVPINPLAKKAETVPLILDLQDEDRDKPHWMSSVDWATVEKRDYVRQPAGTEQGGEFAPTQQGARAALMDVMGEGPVGVDDHPVAIRAAHATAAILREMKAKGYAMPTEIEVRAQAIPSMGGAAEDRGLLEVNVPRTLPADVSLDAAFAATYAGKIAVVEYGELLGEVRKFVGTKFSDLIVHEMGHINRQDMQTVEYNRRLNNLAEAEAASKAFAEELAVLSAYPPPKQYQAPNSGEFVRGTLIYEHVARASVSNYAATNPDEFVAEVFTALYNGETLPPETMRVYHALRGAKVL